MSGRFYSDLRNQGSLEFTLSYWHQVVIRLGELSLVNLQLLQLERDKNIDLMYCHNLFIATQNGGCSVYL